MDNYIFCAGWNQRLHVGKLNYNIVKKGKDNSAVVVVETINLEMVGMSFVDVADVGDLDVQHESSSGGAYTYEPQNRDDDDIWPEQIAW